MKFLLPMAAHCFQNEKSNLLCFQSDSSPVAPGFNSSFTRGKLVHLNAFVFKGTSSEHLEICPGKTRKWEADVSARAGRSDWRQPQR